MPAVADDCSDVPTNAAGLESWNDFLARGRGVADAVVDARTASVTAASAGGLFFSSGTTSLPKGILHSQRAFALQWWRYPRIMKVEGTIRSRSDERRVGHEGGSKCNSGCVSYT